MTNFTICYTVINFESGEKERVEKTFISADNTRAYVAMLNKCEDVQYIDVINGMTGEVLDEFNVSTSEPKPEIEPSKRWVQSPCDGKWSFQCDGIDCRNCPYEFCCNNTDKVNHEMMIDLIQTYGDVHD